MTTDPCNVCGATELNLIDGYYYCVECGTQDSNVRETIVENTFLADGTVALTQTKKITKIKRGVQMSGEWYKWHTFNFILAGLTDELISLGAAPSVKAKVLWIWTRYIKKFQIKEEMSKTNNLEDNTIDNNEKCSSDDESDNIKKRKKEKMTNDIQYLNTTKMLAILYIALNLDQSDIQLYHLFRFAKEGKLSNDNYKKFLPAEINIRCNPQCRNFTAPTTKYTQLYLRHVAMTFFKDLDLGVPLVPNLTTIIDNFITELCLPLDFRDFVLSLIHLMPCDFLQIGERDIKYLVRVPNYEVICMSYLLLGLKICFGLDDDYEMRLSDAVDTINYNENHLKSYKLGSQPEPSNRLFSFRDWCNHLQIRKRVLSKYHIHSAQKYGLPIDDYILLKQVPKRFGPKANFRDNIAMDVLNKIQVDNIPRAITKEEFPPTLTPLTTYLEVIGQCIQDPDIKLLLCEDFTQYSLKYATRDLKLIDSDFKLTGVSKSYKTINNYVSGYLVPLDSDKSIVYVRNCENQNWLKTNPPTIDHIRKNTEQNSPCDRDSDQDVDEHNSNDGLAVSIKDTEDNIHTSFNDEIDEESIGVNIFDDEFIEETEDHMYNNDTSKEEEHELEFNCNEIKTEENVNVVVNENDYSSDDNDDLTDINPDEIDRNKIIDKLIEIACKKYKILLPKKDKPRKRKIYTPEEKALAKKRKFEIKAQGGESKNPENLVSVYYKTLEEDVFNRISEHVKNVVQAVVNKMESNSNISQNLPDESIDEHNITNGENEIESNINRDDIAQENSVVEDSILSDNDTDERLLPKINPDYDANTHDIRQLYVKLEEEIQNEDIFDVHDINLEKIIDKQIKEDNACEDVLKSNDNLKDISNIFDSDDDLPLSVYKDEIIREANKRKFKNLKLEDLLAERNMKEFNFWRRCYKSLMFIKATDMSEGFNVELKKNFPKSFVFVLNECASLIDCTTFHLYKDLQNLERRLMAYNRYE